HRAGHRCLFCGPVVDGVVAHEPRTGCRRLLADDVPDEDSDPDHCLHAWAELRDALRRPGRHARRGLRSDGIAVLLLLRHDPLARRLSHGHRCRQQCTVRQFAEDHSHEGVRRVPRGLRASEPSPGTNPALHGQQHRRRHGQDDRRPEHLRGDGGDAPARQGGGHFQGGGLAQHRPGGDRRADHAAAGGRAAVSAAGADAAALRGDRGLTMKPLRIGTGCGFWGDNLDAPILLAEQGQLDYLTLEYLAELTMSILALQKQRDPQAGFATDFLDVLERLRPVLQAQPRLRIVTNAGGMNPAACAAKARALLTSAGLADRPVATVTGDDLLPHLDQLLHDGHALAHLDTGEPLAAVRSRVVSANAYLGAPPIVEALHRGAAAVIAGGVADASWTVAPAVHELGWSWNDWDRLSGATVAGHLIECGAQATGGLWCNWTEAADLAGVGYPLAEMETDGSFHL